MAVELELSRGEFLPAPGDARRVREAPVTPGAVSLDAPAPVVSVEAAAGASRLVLSVRE